MGKGAVGGKDGEVNYIHETEIWRQRLKTETEGAAAWHGNWGFLTGKELPEPRGFSTNVAKYAYGGNKWTVSSMRVPDDSAEGLAAAQSEQKARKLMSTLTWMTEADGPCKPAAAKGVRLVNERRAVESREAALLMRSHKFQSLGDACLTEGVDPGVKYTRPVLTSHEYGWRAPTSSNTRPPLEMFGVADHAKKQVVKKLCAPALALLLPRERGGVIVGGGGPVRRASRPSLSPHCWIASRPAATKTSRHGQA